MPICWLLRRDCTTRGKRHECWKRAFNAPRDGKDYAKTKGPINVRRLDGYRHEFGSLPRAEKDEELKGLPPGLQELALHLIAAHHGWARPVIPTSGSDQPPSVLEERARDVTLRFARVQKQWGTMGTSLVGVAVACCGSASLTRQ